MAAVTAIERRRAFCRPRTLAVANASSAAFSHGARSRTSGASMALRTGSLQTSPGFAAPSDEAHSSAAPASFCRVASGTASSFTS